MPDPLAWQDRAAGAQVGGVMWFPDQGGSTKDIKKICATCPVRQKCLDYALALPPEMDRFGVYGGKSERERRAIRKAAKAAA
jgi:WhiB family redox-sensing transcriptional regulator